jgi:hypothetical protein
MIPTAGDLDADRSGHTPVILPAPPARRQANY